MQAIANTERPVEDNIITGEQVKMIEVRACEAMVRLAINTILCMGIIAAIGGLIFWLETPVSVAVFGFLSLGLMILSYDSEMYRIFSNASALIGAGALIGGARLELMKKLLNFLVVGILFVFIATKTNAIATRHDLNDADYIVSYSDYPAVVTLFEPSDCTGTLIDKFYLLTVAHCADDLHTYDTLIVNEKSYHIAKIIKHPDWRKYGNAFDIALIQFTEPVKGVSPIPVYRDTNELGSIVTLIGHGLHSTGLQGESKGNNDGKLRKATNIVTAVNNHFIEIIFESPDTIGVTVLEGIGISGDSGGPAFIDVTGTPHIAGLNSYGQGDNGSRIGQYGSRDYQTRVSQYLEWIDKIVGLSP